MFVHGYVAEGERLSIVTLIQREEDHDVIPADPDLSRYPAYTDALLNHLGNWVPETYIAMGLVERGSSIHHSLLNEERTIDGRSVIVFAAAENNLTDIKAFIRIAHRGYGGDNGRLPMELRNPRIRMDEESVEMKNAIQKPGASRNYMSVIFAQAIRSGVLGVGTRQALVDGQLRYVMPRFFTGETHGGTVRAFINEWGFELLSEITDPSRPFEHYLRMPSENALTLDQRLGAPRPGRRAPLPTDPSLFRSVDWAPVRGLAEALSCAPALGAPTVPFYKEVL